MLVLVEHATSSGDWLVVDRVSSVSPTAELILECALARTTSRPNVLVIDSLERLTAFKEGPTRQCLSALAAVRQGATPVPSKGKSPLASETSSSAAEVLAQFYSFESFLDPIKVMQQANGADLPRTPDPEHSKLVAVPRVAWAYQGGLYRRRRCTCDHQGRVPGPLPSLLRRGLAVDR